MHVKEMFAMQRYSLVSERKVIYIENKIKLQSISCVNCGLKRLLYEKNLNFNVVSSVRVCGL